MGALDLTLNIKKVTFNTDKWLLEVLKTIGQERGQHLLLIFVA